MRDDDVVKALVEHVSGVVREAVTDLVRQGRILVDRQGTIVDKKKGWKGSDQHFHSTPLVF